MYIIAKNLKGLMMSRDSKVETVNKEQPQKWSWSDYLPSRKTLALGATVAAAAIYKMSPASEPEAQHTSFPPLISNASQTHFGYDYYSAPKAPQANTPFTYGEIILLLSSAAQISSTALNILSAYISIKQQQKYILPTPKPDVGVLRKNKPSKEEQSKWSDYLTAKTIGAVAATGGALGALYALWQVPDIECQCSYNPIKNTTINDPFALATLPKPVIDCFPQDCVAPARQLFAENGVGNFKQELLLEQQQLQTTTTLVLGAAGVITAGVMKYLYNKNPAETNLTTEQKTKTDLVEESNYNESIRKQRSKKSAGIHQQSARTVLLKLTDVVANDSISDESKQKITDNVKAHLQNKNPKLLIQMQQSAEMHQRFQEQQQDNGAGIGR
jgi:hypothetical protein